MDEENKRRFDALMQLVDFRTKRIAGRRDHEWKVTIGLWALVGAGIVNVSSLPGHSCLLGVGLAIIWALHVAWISRHWHESRIDADFCFVYADNAREILEDSGVNFQGHPLFESIHRATRPRTRLMNFWRGLFTACPPIATTLVLALALLYLDWHKP